jgi:ABC-2 type transport system permease protein
MKVILANIIAIYRRELQSYFVSPFAYIVAGVFWLLAGLILFILLLAPNVGFIARVALVDQLGSTDPIDLPMAFLQSYLGVFGSITFFFLPILSMGLYSEERKRGTLELLSTSPITNWAVAVGKLLGVVTFFMTMILPLMIYEAVVFAVSDPPISPLMIFVGHGGLILLAAAGLSMGMFISSLTDNTILSAILTFALMLGLSTLSLVGSGIGGPVGGALQHLSLLEHYTTWIQGTPDTKSIVLFLSYILLGIFLTAQSIEAFRFQRT